MEGAGTAERGEADPASQNSVPTEHSDQTDDADHSGRRHSMGPPRRGSGQRFIFLNKETRFNQWRF